LVFSDKREFMGFDLSFLFRTENNILSEKPYLKMILDQPVSKVQDVQEYFKYHQIN
jgi:hypothetical protein